MSTPVDVKIVIVLSADFIDATSDSFVLDTGAGDSWTTDDVTGDIAIHLAPKPERHLVVKDRRGEHVVPVLAQPQHTVIWFKHAMKKLAWHEAQAPEQPAYQPKM